MASYILQRIASSTRRTPCVVDGSSTEPESQQRKDDTGNIFGVRTTRDEHQLYIINAPLLNAQIYWGNGLYSFLQTPFKIPSINYIILAY
jgi:hypothetical protein